MSWRMWGVISRRASWLIGCFFTLTGVALAFSLMTTRCVCLASPISVVFVHVNGYLWTHGFISGVITSEGLGPKSLYCCYEHLMNVAFSKWTLDFHALLLGSYCNWKHLCYLLNWLADHILGYSLNVKKLGLWRKAVDAVLMMEETIVLFSKNSADQEYKTVSSVMKERGTLYSSPSGVTSRKGKTATPLVLFIV